MCNCVVDFFVKLVVWRHISLILGVLVVGVFAGWLLTCIRRVVVWELLVEGVCLAKLEFGSCRVLREFGEVLWEGLV